MLEIILGILHNATTFLFGVYISAAFLGVRMKIKNILILLVFSLLCGGVFLLSYVLFGEDVTEKLYPLIIHLPLVLFLTFYYKYKASLSVLSVLTAYLCCQISNWIGIAAMNLAESNSVYYAVRIVVTAIAFLLLIRFVSDVSAKLLQKPTKAIMIFAMMPIVYYIFDYAACVYTELLYTGTAVVVEFLGFIICLFYILFLFLYFKQYEEKCEAEQRTKLMEMQQRQSEKELDAIRRAKHEVSIFRHDMRHYLSNIFALVEGGENDKAKTYISELIGATEMTSMQKYCKNEIVNMILSLHEEKILESGIKFSHDIKIPEKLPFSDVDITAILSNALENAIKAVQPLEKTKRYIELYMHINDTKLLISLKNTFAEKPIFKDGLPIAKKNGHGIGTESIRYITEKLNGNCQFTIDGEMFVLRVIL